MLYKRTFDVSLSLFGIFLFLPLALFFALAVKLEDRGPLFYIQERWGRGGRKFRAYKFRTMVPEADEKWGHKPAEENDVRVTRIGRLLRATAMDELPQLWNILKGDMSFVGPRALAAAVVENSHPQFLSRHEIRPGLTGPAQVYTSRDASLEEKFRYDLEYIRNRNFWGDLGLMSLSVWITLRARWESRQKKV